MSDLNTLSLNQLQSRLRSELASTVEALGSTSTERQQAPEKNQILHSTYTSLTDFSAQAKKGLQHIKEMQLAIEDDALDKIMKMDLTGLPGLEALVKANVMQHYAGINHTKMLMIFERACISFEQGDTDMAGSIFIALLFINPFIAALWYCVARCFEIKKDLKQALYAYAVCELLSKGNIYSALDAAECLIASNEKRFASLLLNEVRWELGQGSFSKEVKDRAAKLQEAIGYMETEA
jgi:hypothetical protein